MVHMGYKKKREVFDPKSGKPFKLSRYRMEMFLSCPRCFYLYQRFDFKRPSWPAFTLNSAVDTLFKKEFDVHRAEGNAHPLMEAYGIDAVPLEHPKMDEWRENFKGVKALHKDTNFIFYGAVDDIWVTPNKVLAVVDYKSTSTYREITLDDRYKQAYKRQLEMYQWLLRQQKDLEEAGYRVSDKGFFVYANARKDRKAFDAKLEFDVQIIPYLGDDSWVEGKLVEARECLMQEKIPEPDPECEYCVYRKQGKEYEGQN